MIRVCSILIAALSVSSQHASSVSMARCIDLLAFIALAFYTHTHTHATSTVQLQYFSQLIAGH